MNVSPLLVINRGDCITFLFGSSAESVTVTTAAFLRQGIDD